MKRHLSTPWGPVSIMLVTRHTTKAEQQEFVDQALTIAKMSTTEQKPLLSDGNTAPTKEELGFDFDIDDPEVNIDAVHTVLASSFALWFGGHARGWHPEEVAEAAIRFAVASGELRVVEMARLIPGSLGVLLACSKCGHEYSDNAGDGDVLEVGQFCRCGAKIEKPC